MKKLSCLCLVLVLVMSACTSLPSGGDGHVPLAGLSFGMSVEDAQKAYPRLQESPASEVLPDGLLQQLDLPDGVLSTIPGATDLVLENTSAYGQKATVRLRFMDGPYSEDYTHDFGLYTVLVTFDGAVQADAVLDALEETFDFDRDLKTDRGLDLASKSQLAGLDDETLAALRSYLAQFPVARVSDGERTTIDHSAVVDKVLEATDRFSVYAQPRYKCLAAGFFDPSANELRLDGFMAGNLNAALST